MTGEFGVGPEPRLSRPVALAYLTLVGLVYVSAVAGVVLALLTGQGPWRSDDPWPALPVLAGSRSRGPSSCSSSPSSDPGRSLLSRPLRPLVLLYGGEVAAAWRSVRR